MRFSEKYRPRSLTDIVGQPAVRMLRALTAQPYSCCVLLECQHGGVGKTSAALAFANDLGCVDEFHGLHVVPCSEFSIDCARELFDGNTLRLRPMLGIGWHCVILEEFDWLPAQTQRYLKVAARRKGAKDAGIAVSEKADDAYHDLRDLILGLRRGGFSFQDIADVLYDQGHRTRYGKPWTDIAVRRAFLRLTQQPLTIYTINFKYPANRHPCAKDKHHFAWGSNFAA